MESRDEEVQPQLLSDDQVIVASCDSSRVTIINEGTPLHSAENGLWEIFYINISEEDMVSDHPANTDDNVIPKADEEQIAITDGYLEGIVSFEYFMTKVENSDGSESGMEDSSDTDYEEEVLERNSNDPEYFPEESSNPVKKRKCTRVTKRLPQLLQGLMGEANLRYARGENEDAINLCKEIIRQAPSYAEPFQFLSMCYKDQRDEEMSYQLSLIAAYLSPQSPQQANEWLQLAQVCLKRRDEIQAKKCLAKAVQADPTNLQIHERRCQVLESIGAEKEQLKARLTMLRGVQPENEQKKNEWVELAEKLPGFPLRVAACIQRVGRSVMLLSPAQIISKALNRHCGLVFNNNIIDEIDLKETESMELTEELPFDILSKLCIALVYFKKEEFAFPLIETFIEHDVESFGEIYLDVVEILAEKEFHQQALTLLEILTQSKSFSQAEVWLKYANCLNALNLSDEAIVAFRHVIHLVPSREDAKISLAELFTKLGRHEEALEAVTQDSEATRIEASVLHHKCLLLLKEGKMNQFVAAYKLLMMRHASNIQSKDEVNKTCGAKKVGWESADEDSDVEELDFGASSIKLEEEYRLLRLTCEYLFKEKRLVELERICFTALTSPLFRSKREICREIQFITLQVCLAKGDSYYAYNLARGLLLRNNLDNKRALNLMIQVIMRGDDVRYNRFLVRLLRKHPKHVCLSVLNGHACLASGTYKRALDAYMSACKIDPDNPLFLLLSAIVLVQLTCQKFSSGKHSLVTQACSFFDAYLKSRGDCQEVYYNIGRGMHQLGLLAHAVDF
ncbi:general transcription factor 3C polypeptide 3-like [Daphnia pulicaria]|uniref:general transcription factor 3C polypeptide 3-like n=1 Tax=Daphnia pulicaria TaxID=35523 RepID=UPI001EEA009E|nr:general transcription factor 3C polypeptide 3-like [Daphnia pulicaria]